MIPFSLITVVDPSGIEISGSLISSISIFATAFSKAILVPS